MNAREFKTYLLFKQACDIAIAWADGKSLKEAWYTCKRSDWMLWLIASSKTTITDSQLRHIACDCAERVVNSTTDKRSVKAIEVARRFADENATKEELSAARSAAWSAARSAARSAAWSAARSAALSAARSAARSAAWSATRSSAWSAAESEQANIIRNRYPEITIL